MPEIKLENIPGFPKFNTLFYNSGIQIKSQGQEPEDPFILSGIKMIEDENLPDDITLLVDEDEKKLVGLYKNGILYKYDAVPKDELVRILESILIDDSLDEIDKSFL
jgi:hypothetical protein